MLKPKLNQRGSLLIIELVILVGVALIAAVVVNQARVRSLRATTATPTTNSSTAPSSTVHTTPENNQTATPLAGSGIKGQIYAGSASGCYSADPNSSCNKPRTQAGTVVIKGPNGIIQSVKSNSSGYFLVSANPGTYTIQLQDSPGTAANVIVKAGLYAEVTLYAN